MSSKKYALLPMDDDDLGPAKVERKDKKEKSRKRSDKPSSSREKRRSRSRSLRRREDSRTRDEPPVKALRRRDNEAQFEDRWGDEEYVSEEEDHEPVTKKARISHEEEHLSEDEKERRRDQAEKQAYQARLLSKEKGKKDGDRGVKESMVDDAATRMAALPDLRQKSRYSYLAKRETERVALLRKQVADDDEEIRSGTKLTRQEKEEMRFRKETLRLAQERAAIDTHVEGFQFADQQVDAKKREAALYTRHVERDEYGQEKAPLNEQEEWERDQMAKQRSQVKSIERVDEGEYDYVLDEEQGIQWVMEALPKEGKQLSKEQLDLLKSIDVAESKQKTMQEVRNSLPIYQYRDQLLEALGTYQCLVVVAETGSGKTTQIPQYLREAGYCKGEDGIMKIGVTQPRRVAAMSVAARVAEEASVRLGNEVGFSIRFENNTSDKTEIVYMTDGQLLRILMGDPSLDTYTCIIIDEAHERNVNTDVLLALLKDLIRARPDLKLIISSATLNAALFSEYLDDCPIFNVPGRRFPVDVHYTPQPEANYLAAAITTVFQIHASQPTGDILVFLTGQEEIDSAEEQILQISRKLGTRIKELVVVCIYANLSSELQNKIFEPTPPNARKAILATNIAETSITLDGVSYVVDCGFVKELNYNPANQMSQLAAVPISRASAGQRAGRAGRTGPGKCFRLYTKWSYMNEMEESTTPEIQRTNLNSPVLLLKSLGINDLLDFDFISPPSADMLISALDGLYALGALNSKGELTVVGRKMAELPVDIGISKAILSADKYGCAEEVINVVSMLQESGALFMRPKDKKIHADSARARFTVKDGGDMLTLLKIYQEWESSDYSPIWSKENFLQQKCLTRARDVRDQLAKLCERVEVVLSSCGTEQMPVKKALTAGFFPSASRLDRGGQSYRTLKKNNTIFIHPSSVLFSVDPPPKMIIYFELVLTSKEFARNTMAIEAEWLVEVAPHYHKKKDLEKLEDRKIPKERSSKF
ncbi:putative Pre-mRNA-splicing factor ATP-dependent RNA helicase-like protein cdc28 [Calycina marina]|uniref:RNA helicase n=1 Tax=Calycina marina TaxID=1763456 RepID=A0A9P7ZAI2_9HELO|nr:putative Pre-mRNA-splicing factor ATP-dependent RNA helicase-like protein cdc28 [Calycina marina]